MLRPIKTGQVQPAFLTSKKHLITDVTQANVKSISYKAENSCKLLIVRCECVTSVDNMQADIWRR